MKTFRYILRMTFSPSKCITKAGESAWGWFNKLRVYRSTWIIMVWCLSSSSGGGGGGGGRPYVVNVTRVEYIYISYIAVAHVRRGV